MFGDVIGNLTLGLLRHGLGQGGNLLRVLLGGLGGILFPGLVRVLRSLGGFLRSLSELLGCFLQRLSGRTQIIILLGILSGISSLFGGFFQGKLGISQGFLRDGFNLFTDVLLSLDRNVSQLLGFLSFLGCVLNRFIRKFSGFLGNFLGQFSGHILLGLFDGISLEGKLLGRLENFLGRGFSFLCSLFLIFTGSRCLLGFLGVAFDFLLLLLEFLNLLLEFLESFNRILLLAILGLLKLFQLFNDGFLGFLHQL